MAPMSETPRRRFWLKLSAALLFALIAYGGAYLVAVRAPPTPVLPLTTIRAGFHFDAHSLHGYHTFHFHARYKLPGTPVIANSFFAPAHWIDRRLRPHVWTWVIEDPNHEPAFVEPMPLAPL